ncbi:MAG: creatininase family protein [Eubacteriales bacterium]|nr:creatininase family protein [Eubacteriales bacterium]
MYRSINTMTWAEVAKLDPDSVFYVLPVGSLEQHGRALPLGTDDLILSTSLEEMSRHVELKNNFLQLPNLHYGNSFEHLDFSGTITLGCACIAGFVEEILASMRKHGFHRLVVVNSHGGNAPIFQAYAQEWEQKFGVRVYNINYFGSDFFVEAQSLLQTPVNHDIHGGEIEASYLAYALPGVFHAEEATPENDVFVSLKDYYYGWLSRDLSPDNGLIGMASRATPEKGRLLYEYVWKKLASYFTEFDQAR